MSEAQRRNTEYILQLSQVGGKADKLQKQLNVILQREREKVESQFQDMVHSLKVMQKKKINQVFCDFSFFFFLQ